MQTLISNAKINLGLRILGRRPEDGYHLLETIFQEVDFADEIVVHEGAKAGSFTLSCDHPDIPVNEDNLILKAVQKMRPYLPQDIGLHFELKKRIPPGSGLGGGSSNAAAVLKFLNRRAGLEPEALKEIAVGLGADVPFFLLGGTAYARGTGDILRPVKIPKEWKAVLVFPEINIPTVWAYRQLRISLTGKTKKAIIPSLLKKYFSWQIFENDFEEAIIPSYPEIGEIKSRLYEQGAVYAGLSGSGSTVFGICETCDIAEQAVAAFTHAVIAEPI
ncbi:MAG: 4-(cytidine 5'-diphospho)-2-C-methyl-D-erythritol kinase [Candidatus Marinimicrobia bacterium]|nr:4-(cytidine 5'-diphospho)-2-C-methyl-D-erythritol kinase [Candidatus Neomarinimicrobiota bacterium]